MEQNAKQVKRGDRRLKRVNGLKQEGNKHLKQHIISLRISAVEWDSLHDTMQGLQFKRVSDLMREAFKLLQAPPVSSQGTASAGSQSCNT